MILAEACETIANLLKARSGLVIGTDKLYLLETRLAPVLKRFGLPDLPALAIRLRAAGGDAVMPDVVEAMTTHESFFFRDSKPFSHFAEVLLPRLAATRPAGAPLRIWSAAASSGQEVYSLAMLLSENRATLRGHAVQVLATDIARATLERGRCGVYTQFEVQRGLPEPLLARYFHRHGDGWQANDSIRNMVDFREWNLLHDPTALGRFDVVFCRNVLIYFDQPTKARVLDHIGRVMLPDSTLYLGGTETILGLTDRFAAMPGERGAYCLAGSGGAARPRAIPVPA